MNHSSVAHSFAEIKIDFILSKKNFKKCQQKDVDKMLL